MDRKIAIECSKLSEEEKISFPEVIAELAEAGVEGYTVNLLVPNKVYYGDNQALQIPLSIKADLIVAPSFCAESVIKAIRASQTGQIGYQEFLKQIMAAGVIFYSVFIQGRKAIYVGRRGEQHIEYFPST